VSGWYGAHRAVEPDGERHVGCDEDVDAQVKLLPADQISAAADLSARDTAGSGGLGSTISINRSQSFMHVSDLFEGRGRGRHGLVM
jgi:hypothetical protein